MSIKKSVRFILTDVLPFELPIIFDNKDFAEYLSLNFEKIRNLSFGKMLKQLSLPYDYNIIKDNKNVRRISLMNPLSQIQSSYFIDKYDQNLLSFFNVYGRHSLRVPIGISKTRFNKKEKEKYQIKIEENTNLYSIELSEAEENIEVNNESYFKYDKFNRIHKFEDDRHIKTFEERFKYLLKTDIENCFNSIYTHSISWAYYGDKDFAKSSMGTIGFDSRFDTLMQKSNYSETNGILIGSNLSRIFAEVILTRIDTNIVKSIVEECGLREEKDFKYFRYVDDIYIFLNNRNLEEKFLNIVNDKLSEFKLRRNKEKTFVEERPFMFNKKWRIETNKMLNYVKDYLNNLNTGEPIIKQSFNMANFHTMVKNVVKNNPKDKIRISNFLISSFLNIIRSDIILKKEMEKLKEIKIGFYLNIIEISLYIVSLNISFSNVNYLFQIIMMVHQNFSSSWDYEKQNKFNDLLLKVERIIEVNYTKVEISNLVILLKYLEHDINSDTIKNILNELDDGLSKLFVLISIAFYTLGKNEYKERINNIVNKRIDEYINSSYYPGYIENNNRIYNESKNSTLKSKEYYFFNAFYHYPDINNENKSSIGKMIYSKTKNPDNIIYYLENYKGSFINWKQTKEKSIKEFILNRTNIFEYDNN